MAGKHGKTGFYEILKKLMKYKSENNLLD